MGQIGGGERDEPANGDRDGLGVFVPFWSSRAFLNQHVCKGLLRALPGPQDANDLVGVVVADIEAGRVSDLGLMGKEIGGPGGRA